MKATRTILLITMALNVAAMNPSLALAEQLQMSPQVQVSLLKKDIASKKKLQAKYLSKANLVEKFASQKGAPLYLEHQNATTVIILAGGATLTLAALLKTMDLDLKTLRTGMEGPPVLMITTGLASILTIGITELLNLDEKGALLDSLNASSVQEINNRYNEYLGSVSRLQNEIASEEAQIHFLMTGAK